MMVNILQRHSDEHSLCQLWDEKVVVYLDNLYGSLVNREHVQFGQILASFYHNAVISNVKI